MFGIEEIRTLFGGFFFFIFAGYIIQSEQSIMTLSQDAIAKIILIGTLIGVIIYYFRDRRDEKSPERQTKSEPSTFERNRAKFDGSGVNSVVSRQRSLPCFKIKLNDRTVDEVQLPESAFSDSPYMDSPNLQKNQSEIEQDLETSFCTPKRSTKSIETASFTLDPVTKWSNESGTPITFKRYKSSSNLDTLFENPVEEEEHNSLRTPANDIMSVDWIETVDMEIVSNLSINNGANTTKKSMNVSIDSHDIIDMDIDDVQNAFLKTLELTPLKTDFDNMDISKSTELNSTHDTDTPKLPIIANVEMLSDLFQESFKFETSLDSCANVSLNKDVNTLDELKAHENRTNDVENVPIHTNGNRSDSAIGSEIADEEQQSMTDVAPFYFPFGHPKKESHVIASKPASHSTGSSLTTALNIHPNHQFNFNSSKIPVMREFEYRRSHLRPVKKHE